MRKCCADCTGNSPPKWLPPNASPEQAERTEWEIAVNIRATVRAARRYRTPEVRDALIALLTHPGREVWLAAVGGLLSQGDPADIPALRQAMDDPENPREVVDAAKSAIKQLEQITLPPAPDLEPRRLREELARAAEDKRARVELMQRLTAALRDPSSKVRGRAAKALGELGDKRAAPALAALLRDPVSGVRQAAATALGALKSRQAAPALMRYVEASTDIRQDLPALFALRDIGDPRALPAVLRALEHGPFNLAGILRSHDVIPPLVTRENLPLLEETMVRMEEVYRKLPSPDSRTAPKWVTIKKELERIYGTSLACVADERDISALLAAFERDPHNHAPAEALARLADPVMLAPMRRHLLAGHEDAAEVLAALGIDGLQVFKEALRSPRAETRSMAAGYLFYGRGADAMRMIADEELLRLLDELGQRDPSNAIRLHARAAARRIRKPQIWERLQGRHARNIAVTHTPEQDLKGSVQAQLQLPPLRFTVEPGDLPPAYAKMLDVRITEVFGAPPIIATGGNYLVSGVYTLQGSGLEMMVLAARGRMSGYEQALKRGSHPFTLYGHVLEAASDGTNRLSILVFPEGGEYAVAYIRLEEETG